MIAKIIALGYWFTSVSTFRYIHYVVGRQIDRTSITSLDTCNVPAKQSFLGPRLWGMHSLPSGLFERMQHPAAGLHLHPVLLLPSLSCLWCSCGFQLLGVLLGVAISTRLQALASSHSLGHLGSNGNLQWFLQPHKAEPKNHQRSFLSTCNAEMFFSHLLVDW